MPAPLAHLKPSCRFRVRFTAWQKSLRVIYAAWMRMLGDQQDLQAGNALKAIPTEPTRLSFVEESK